MSSAVRCCTRSSRLSAYFSNLCIMLPIISNFLRRQIAKRMHQSFINCIIYIASQIAVTLENLWLIELLTTLFSDNESKHNRAFKSTTTTTTTVLPPPGGLDFVRDYPGEPVPERQNQEGKTNLDLVEQEIVSGSGISWAICKSALRPTFGHFNNLKHMDDNRHDANFPLLMDLRALAMSSNEGLSAGSSAQHCFIRVTMPGSTLSDSCGGSGGR